MLSSTRPQVEDPLMGDGKKTGADIGLLILRLTLGGIMIAHGVQKIMVENGVAKFADTLAGIGVSYQPLAMAITAITTEIGGGFLVVLGLFSRLAALAIAVLMGVAIVLVHWKNGFWLPLEITPEAVAGQKIPQGFEYCLALLSMALCILFAGPGHIRVPVGKG
ncbi:MAG TPA: DoxX family protein [Planctomycetota bacterium]|nr:DoxX family protein [Planctomycetota bacterium]